MGNFFFFPDQHLTLISVLLHVHLKVCLCVFALPIRGSVTLQSPDGCPVFIEEFLPSCSY